MPLEISFGLYILILSHNCYLSLWVTEFLSGWVCKGGGLDVYNPPPTLEGDERIVKKEISMSGLRVLDILTRFSGIKHLGKRR